MYIYFNFILLHGPLFGRNLLNLILPVSEMRWRVHWNKCDLVQIWFNINNKSKGTHLNYRIRVCSRCCLKLFYFVWLIVSGYSLESKDELVDALPTLKQRAAENDPNILFSVASDLSKVRHVLFWFIVWLSIDSAENSSISRCHVLLQGLQELMSTHRKKSSVCNPCQSFPYHPCSFIMCSFIILSLLLYFYLDLDFFGVFLGGLL